MFKRLKVITATCLASGLLSTGVAKAQGIPVIDSANLVQTIQQVLNDITSIQNQVQQISQLQNHLNSINGIRNLGQVFNSAALQNYVPAEAQRHGQDAA